MSTAEVTIGIILGRTARSSSTVTLRLETEVVLKCCKGRMTSKLPSVPETTSAAIGDHASCEDDVASFQVYMREDIITNCLSDNLEKERACRASGTRPRDDFGDTVDRKSTVCSRRFNRVGCSRLLFRCSTGMAVHSSLNSRRSATFASTLFSRLHYSWHADATQHRSHVGERNASTWTFAQKFKSGDAISCHVGKAQAVSGNADSP